MITVEELKEKFPVRDVRPYGECIVIPGDEFDPDWEHYLAEQGFKCFFIDLDRKPVTLVKLKTQTKADSPPKEVYHPESQKRRQPVAPWLNPESRWKPEEDELIISLWNQRQDTLQIHAEFHKRFPNRSINAVKCRVTRLIKAGKIPGRWHKGERKKKAVVAQAGPEPAKPNVSQTSPKGTPKVPGPSTAAHTTAHTPSYPLRIIVEPMGKTYVNLADLDPTIKRHEQDYYHLFFECRYRLPIVICISKNEKEFPVIRIEGFLTTSLEARA